MIDRTYHLARRGSQQFDVQPSATNVLLLDELLDRTRGTASDAASVSKHSCCVSERASEREHALGIALVRLGLVESCLPGFVGFDIADATDMLEHRKRSNQDSRQAIDRERARERERDGAAMVAYLDLLRRPLVKVGGFDLGDVRAKATMDTRASDANEDTDIGAGPAWSYAMRPRESERERRRLDDGTRVIKVAIPLEPQSAQISLPGSFNISASILACCSNNFCSLLLAAMVPHKNAVKQQQQQHALRRGAKKQLSERRERRKTSRESSERHEPARHVCSVVYVCIRSVDTGSSLRRSSLSSLLVRSLLLRRCYWLLLAWADKSEREARERVFNMGLCGLVSGLVCGVVGFVWDHLLLSLIGLVSVYFLMPFISTSRQPTRERREIH